MNTTPRVVTVACFYLENFDYIFHAVTYLTTGKVKIYINYFRVENASTTNITTHLFPGCYVKISVLICTNRERKLHLIISIYISHEWLDVLLLLLLKASREAGTQHRNATKLQSEQENGWNRVYNITENKKCNVGNVNFGFCGWGHKDRCDLVLWS